MIDTHCHLTFAPLYEQVDAVLARAAAAGVHRMITVGTSPSDARTAAALAQAREPVFATVGLHPHEADKCNDRTLIVQTMRDLAAHPKVVALGEMGLDKHYPDPPIADQRRAFAWQLEVMTELDLPGIIHNREATDDVLTMIRDHDVASERFVFHCFTGSAAELDAVLESGAMVSFTGIVTFNNANDLAEASDRVPLDRLMVETDSPYLTPEPHRKVHPNEPCYVPHIARFLAARRGISEPQFVATMDTNAQRFFGI